VRLRWLLAALALLVAGCFDPIVGARCADGYVPCKGQCVAVCTADGGQSPLPDGAAPTGDAAPSSPETGLVPDGGLLLPDGAHPDDSGATPSDAGKDAAAPTDGALHSDAQAIDDAAASDAASASDTGPADAGATDSALDDAATTDAAIDDAATTDTLVADAGPPPDAPPPIDCGTQTLCPIGCVNLDDDPDNCGACGRSCGTGLCVSGVCQQRQAGHLVVIGHDYTVSRTAMDNIVGNAIFLAPGPSVKVLAYQGAATSDEIRGTDAAIQKVAASTGRNWVKTALPAQDVPAALAFADVFLIYAQPGATDPQLLTLGNDWATALSDFVQGGKVIVLLDAPSANAGTFQIVQQASLFHATGRFELVGQTMMVARPGDAIATRVPQTYRGERGTVWFATLEPVVVVQTVTDAGLQPVVIHMVF
jgi:hypothetical protein